MLALRCRLSCVFFSNSCVWWPVWLSAETCFHRLTWTKMMPCLRPATVILQKRGSHRGPSLPWYTRKYKNTWLRIKRHVGAVPCGCTGSDSDSQRDVRAFTCSHVTLTVRGVWSRRKSHVWGCLATRLAGLRTAEVDVLCQCCHRHLKPSLSLPPPPPQLLSGYSSFLKRFSFPASPWEMTLCPVCLIQTSWMSDKTHAACQTFSFYAWIVFISISSSYYYNVAV